MISIYLYEKKSTIYKPENRYLHVTLFALSPWDYNASDFVYIASR